MKICIKTCCWRFILSILKRFLFLSVVLGSFFSQVWAHDDNIRRRNVTKKEPQFFQWAGISAHLQGDRYTLKVPQAEVSDFSLYGMRTFVGGWYSLGSIWRGRVGLSGFYGLFSRKLEQEQFGTLASGNFECSFYGLRGSFVWERDNLFSQMSLGLIGFVDYGLGGHINIRVGILDFRERITTALQFGGGARLGILISSTWELETALTWSTGSLTTQTQGRESLFIASGQESRLSMQILSLSLGMTWRFWSFPSLSRYESLSVLPKN